MGEAFSRCCSAPKKEDVQTIKEGPGYNHEGPEPDYGYPQSSHYHPTVGLAPGALPMVANAIAAEPAPKPLPTRGEHEYVVQDDPALLAIQIDGRMLAGCSAKYMEPEKLKEFKGPGKQKFMFGRSESAIEGMLRNSGDASDPPAIGTYLIRDGAGEADKAQRKSARIRFAETVERTVVEEEVVHDAHVEGDPSPSAGARSASNEPLSFEAIQALKVFFDKLDADGSSEISMEEAIEFWGKGFSKISAAAMFAEVDADGNGSICLDEFMTFWQNVKHSGYTEAEILEELQQLMEGGMWVDWKDGRCTGAA